MDIRHTKIAFMGAGKMATAFAKGLLPSLGPGNISAFDVSERAAVRFAEATGIKCEDVCSDALKDADLVIVAVKPQDIMEALGDARDCLSGKVLLSIAAGVKIDTLKKLSGCEKIIRVMPNTPALVGEGMSAYCVSDKVSAEEQKFAEHILAAVGKLARVDETHMDAITGLSGSGPAYVFEFIDALKDGGVKAGLDETLAYGLAVQTVIGAVKLLSETGECPATLRDNVTSPGGTTEKGLEVLRNRSFRQAVADAVVAAKERSVELGANGK